MRRLMGNQGTAAQLLIECRIFIQEHPAVRIECSSRMLHAAELEAGKDDEIVFGKRIRNSRILLQPRQGIENLGGDLRTLSYFFRVCLTMVNGNLPVLPRIRFANELSGCKGKQIGTQRLRLLERDDFSGPEQRACRSSLSHRW